MGFQHILSYNEIASFEDAHLWDDTGVLYTGIRILRKKYYPATFFVAGYSFLLLGFSIRVLKTLATQNLPFGPINFYSLTFCFLMEMLFVSFAITTTIPRTSMVMAAIKTIQ